MSEEQNPEIMKVNEVREEYEYIKTQTCDKCGVKGRYKMEMQRLVDNGGCMCDELDCICVECGAKKTFVFDVSKLFEGYKDMLKE